MDKTASVNINGHSQNTSSLIRNILESLKSQRVAKSTIFDIKLSMEEAIVNALKHGNRGNKDLSVKVSYYISDDAFKVSIEDSGAGFDYNKLPDPTHDENLLRTAGRGVYLIRHLMDEVYFNKNGNEITMIKYLKSRKSEREGKRCS